MTMIKNYFKIARRNLIKNKSYAFINIMGLALSITCGILIFSLVNYHLSFDNFHNNANRIYRIVTEQHRDNISYTDGVPSPLGKAIRTDYNFTEKIARIATFDEQLITINTDKGLKKFKEKEGASFTEPEYFSIFNFPLLQGNISTALNEPNTAVVTERIAKKYFGNDNAVNKIFRVENKVDCRITGILKDLPENTDQKAEIFISYATLKSYDDWLAKDDSWGGIQSGMHCYAVLKKGVTAEAVEKVLPAYVKKYRPTSKNVHHYKLQPLADVHFNPHYGGAMEKRNLWVLSFIGLFLIITACVNFINLATAQALNRSKEVGVRKTLGSLRLQLFWQFITETGLITIIATGIAYGLSWVALPYVNDWFGIHISLNILSSWQLPLFMLLLAVLVTFFSGSYPGIILSGFNPVQAIKGKLSQQSIGGLNTRRSLIITQFAISQVLIIGMIVVMGQMKYAKQSDLGFNKEGIVLIPFASGADSAAAETLRNRFSTIPGVEKVSLCYAAPLDVNGWTTSMRYDNHTEDEASRVNYKAGDAAYLSTFDLKLIAGRNFFPSDTVREYVVNETMLTKLGIRSPGDIIGKTLRVDGTPAPVVGVVKDFHDKSFHEDINAVCISSFSNLYQTFAVKINLANSKATTAALEKAWSDMNPNSIYESEFLDATVAAFYQTEDLMLKLVQVFSLIAIFIGCLGLYGLVSFMAAQKTKEIGIRKVLGSTVTQILWLFGKEFSRLVIIAFIVAAPLAWWVMTSWLQDFKFRINISIWFFVFAISITFIVAAVTVGYLAIKAAIANPVKSLRTE
ncbi:ADOP family protein [Ferruginibacter profundus]